MTIGELNARMSSYEFSRWMKFDAQRNQMREDLQRDEEMKQRAENLIRRRR